MDDRIRNEVAESLEHLADQPAWNPELWWRCHDLVKANWDDELLEYVYDDIVHYSGLFHSRNIFGFRVKPDRYQLRRYRQEFRDIATCLRSRMSLSDAKKSSNCDLSSQRGLAIITGFMILFPRSDFRSRG